jgi:hypothetical protein
MSRINNFDTYVFRRGPHAARHSVMLGNVGRFAPTEAQVFAYYGTERVEETVPLGPRAHAEVALAPERGGQPLTRVETKSLHVLQVIFELRRGRRAAGEEHGEARAEKNFRAETLPSCRRHESVAIRGKHRRCEPSAE